MSTPLNDVVFDLYAEFSGRLQESARRSEQASCRNKLKRAIRNPALILGWLYRKLKGKFEYFSLNDYGRAYIKLRRKAIPRGYSPLDLSVYGNNVPDVKIAVYSAVVGGYDDIKDPVYIDDSIDYYLVTDNTEGGGVYGNAFLFPGI